MMKVLKSSKRFFNIHESINPSARIFAKSSRSSFVKPAVFEFVDGFAKSIL